MWINTKTIPTVGRVVWYWPTAERDDGKFIVLDEAQPFRADVIFVDDAEQRVTLQVTDHAGNMRTRTNVPLCDLPTGTRLIPWKTQLLHSISCLTLRQALQLGCPTK